MRDLGAPNVIPLPGPNFLQQASVSYNADGSSVSGLLPVTGWFTELLNASTHQSASWCSRKTATRPFEQTAMPK
ncbi:hypothetical protein [Mycobacterium sp.]|uniref:hypothetical protein n=1 Tax=Mycobacterium sp. TaxID=1785 RepID=UPI003F95BB61